MDGRASWASGVSYGFPYGSLTLCSRLVCDLSVLTRLDLCRPAHAVSSSSWVSAFLIVLRRASRALRSSMPALHGGLFCIYLCISNYGLCSRICMAWYVAPVCGFFSFLRNVFPLLCIFRRAGLHTTLYLLVYYFLLQVFIVGFTLSSGMRLCLVQDPSTLRCGLVSESRFFCAQC